MFEGVNECKVYKLELPGLFWRTAKGQHNTVRGKAERQHG